MIGADGRREILITRTDQAPVTQASGRRYATAEEVGPAAKAIRWSSRQCWSTIAVTPRNLRELGLRRHQLPAKRFGEYGLGELVAAGACGGGGLLDAVGEIEEGVDGADDLLLLQH